MNKCNFCQLSKQKKLKIYEDKIFIGILDLFPITKGHSLIVTKKHIDDLFLLNEKERNKMLAALFTVSQKINEAFSPPGFTFILNNRLAKVEPGKNHISHIHFHIIPRYKKNELIIKHNRTKLTLEELMKIKNRVLSGKLCQGKNL